MVDRYERMGVDPCWCTARSSKPVGPREQRGRWVRFPCTPAIRSSNSLESAARTSGGQRLMASLPPWSDDFKMFQERLWRVQSTPYSLCARSFERRIDLDLLGRGWWLTFADGDLA